MERDERGTRSPRHRAGARRCVVPRIAEEKTSMESIRHRFWRVPDRLSPRRARGQCGLAAAVLAPALGGLAVESEGPPRLLSAILLGLAGTSNFAWAIGSLLP